MTDKEYKYYAFISYKREDERWAKWLQSKLMHYRIPTSIRRAKPDLPKNVHPVFRDSTDLSGGVLAEAINNALDNSRYLIVICSPRAAQSRWVCKEVQHFIDTGREKYIIPFIVEGTPNSNDVATECFPEALRTLAGSRELLGININEMGRDAAAIKVVARMFGLEFNDLWRRYERYRRRRIELFALIMLLITAIAIGVGVYIANQNSVLTATNRQMQINQARFVSEKAMQLIEEGDSYTAAKLALAVYDKLEAQNTTIPFELERVLRVATEYGVATLDDHSDDVNSVEFSPDGSLVASASSDHTVKLWQTANGKCIKTLVEHSDIVNSVTFSPNGEYIVSASNDDTIKLWEVSGNNTKAIKTYTAHGDDVIYVAFCDDGMHIVSASKDNTIRLWKINGNNTKSINTYIGHNDDVDSIIFSPDPDSKYIVSVSRDNTIKLWETGYYNQEIYTFTGSKEYITNIVFGPNGRHLATASSDNTIKIWEIDKNLKYVIKCFTGHSARFSKDGKYLVSVSPNVINLWEVEGDDKEPIKTYVRDIYGTDSSATFSNNGKYIISYTTNIKLWEVKGNNENAIKTFTGHLYGINYAEFSHNDKYIVSASGDNTIKLWKVEGNNTTAIKTFEEHTDGVNYATFSNDGKYIVSASDDDTIKIWEVEGDNCESIKTFKEHTNSVRSAEFSSDGKYIVSASWDGSIKLWEVKGDNNKAIKTFGDHNIGDISSCAISRDIKHILSESSYHTVKLWEVTSGNHIDIVKHDGGIRDVRFSPDKNNKYIITVNYDDEIQIWDRYNTKELQSFKLLEPKSKIYKYPDNYQSAEFDYNCRYIALSRSDWTTTLIEFKPIQEIADETRERFKDNPLTAQERREYYIE